MKIVFLFLLLNCFAFADNWGVIEQINDREKTIMVKNSTIKILPYTEIEEEICLENGFRGQDIPRAFKDLKVGQVIEVDFLGVENNVLLAEEIEIKCNNSAY